MMAKNRLIVGEDTEVEFYLDKFITQVGAHHVETYLHQLLIYQGFGNISFLDIQPIIAQRIAHIASDLQQVTDRLQDVSNGQKEYLNSDGSRLISRNEGS
jgi:hypothetical protein